MENFLLPNEIVLKILGYLSLGDLTQCAKVSKRFNTICKDKSLSYRFITLVMKSVPEKDQKSVKDTLINTTKMTICTISWEGGLQTSLSGDSDWDSLGLYEKAETLQTLGASVRVMHVILSKEMLGLEVFYCMPTLDFQIEVKFQIYIKGIKVPLVCCST